MKSLKFKSLSYFTAKTELLKLFYSFFRICYLFWKETVKKNESVFVFSLCINFKISSKCEVLVNINVLEKTWHILSLIVYNKNKK